MQFMRVATFNIKDLFSPAAEHAHIFEKKLEWIASHILRSEASVVALQEVGDDAAFARLHAAGLSDYDFVLGTADERGIRCAILSRLKIEKKQVHVTDELPFPEFVEGDPQPYAGRLKLRRGIVQVDVEMQGIGRISVITHHMKSNLPRRLQKRDGTDEAITSGFSRGNAIVRSAVMRSAEALYLRQLVDGLEADHVCVLGDFNDDRKSAPLRILAGDRDAPRPLWQMIDRVPEHKRWSTLYGGRPSHIDHILVTPSLADHVRSGDIMNESLVDHGPYVPGAVQDPTADSDHALYWLEIT
jgi:endonuclease/exonuclease/phosphatase family metal-dependent hydrolase